MRLDMKTSDGINRMAPAKIEPTLTLSREQCLALDLYLEHQYIHYNNEVMHQIARKVQKFCEENITNATQATEVPAEAVPQIPTEKTEESAQNTGN